MLRLAPLLLALVDGPALAQSEPDRPRERARAEEVLEIDFDALEIEGALVEPNGPLMCVFTRPRMNPLLALRRDFDDALLRSVAEVR